MNNSKDVNSLLKTIQNFKNSFNKEEENSEEEYGYG